MLRQLSQSAGEPDWVLPWLRTTATAVAALASTTDEIAPVLALKAHPDPQIRGLVAVSAARHSGPDSLEALQALVGDSVPWIRAAAGAALGGEAGIKAILSAGESLSIVSRARALAAASPTTPVPQTLGWFATADLAGRYALSDLWIGWKWGKAVKELAPWLDKGDAPTRDVVYRTLKGVTGRDFGRGSAAGWLSWTPEAKP
ncbi:MAG: hypothetical protein ACI9WU_004103 [Myxococcota bacterium]